MPVDLAGDPPYGLDALSRRLNDVLADLQRAADAGERATDEDEALDDLESNFRNERYG